MATALYQMNYNGLRQKPTYDQLIGEIAHQPIIRYPDRRAKQLRETPYLSQLDGDGIFEGKYSTTGTIVLKNKFIGTLNSDQTIIDTDGIFEGDLKTEELIISGFVNGKVEAENIVIMEMGGCWG